MPLDFADYTKLLKRTYYKRRADNELSLLLAQSTPAKIRQACLHVYKERFEKQDLQALKKDEQLLKDFFGPAEPGKRFLKLIEEFEAHKFKPLDNYLKKDKGNTDKKNLELLAWLIDFRHRPYVFGKNFELNEEENLLLQDEPTMVPSVDTEDDLGESLGTVQHISVGEKEPTVPFIKEEKQPDTGKRKKWIIAVWMLVIFTGAVSAFWQPPTQGQAEIVNNLPELKPIADDPQQEPKQKADSLKADTKAKPVKRDTGLKLKTASPNTANLTTGLCRRITKKGMPCKRKAQYKGYCWQHV
ncbi:hypothetical protein [Ferruginibacter sp. HRS2-29]|uniref:hypothetical protein n=1 Tax=Ferruginibacter sp. HRS2-29 TaxID=2487334 RepID=UPI0020CFC1C3|nr:hypothetical protein [Ferruginibacter sp. HRS2-29]MCP9752262.1 hypothetical protein [Ferruginibacter sp. HRS2-29]